MSASTPAIKRIMQELKDMKKNPSDTIIAAPLDDNLFEWHFTIKGAEDTEFEGGKYHGKFILPAQYPFKAPDVYFLNKSGRFEINTKICLSFTGYHHELWQPAWTIRTMLTSIRAFMETPAKGVGAISVDKKQRRKYAKMSANYKCPKCDIMMKDIQFPICKKAKDKNKKQKDEKDKNDKESTESPKCDANNSNTNENEEVQSEIVNNEETEIERRRSAEIHVDEMKQIEDNSNNENNGNNEMNLVTRSPSTAPKETWLDSVTVLLVMAILAILLKKFLVIVMDQM